MGAFSWLGFQTRSDEPGPSDPSTALVIPSRSADPRSVTTGDALGLSMVFRAVQILGTSVKQLSIHAERNGVELTSQPSLIRQPNVYDPRSVFYDQTTESLSLTGNAYWLIDRDASGRVTNLTVLNPHEVTFDYTKWGRVTKWHYLGEDFAPDRIQHLKFLRVPGAVKGLGPIQAAQYELRGAIDTRDYATNWFDSSGMPAGYLGTDSTLNPEQTKLARDTWKKAVGDREGVPVLTGGFKFVNTFINPADAQWLEARQFDTTAIARLFGIPASLMLATVEGNSQSYSNVEQDWLAFVRFTLMAYLSEIEEAMSALLPTGTRARFNIEALLRADTTTRYAAHAVALTSGFLTVDEVRAIEKLPPLPESEKTVLSAPAPGSDSTEEEDSDA